MFYVKYIFFLIFVAFAQRCQNVIPSY